MTREEAIEILEEVKAIDDSIYQYNTKYLEALELAIKALEQCEIWNGIHGQIVAPKGTFNKIWEDADKSEDKI